MNMRMVALWVVMFINFITSSKAVLKQHQRVHAISTFHSKKGPIGPPRPRDQVQRQGNEEDDYYEYYEESETSASTTHKSLTVEEVVRKLTARPPGFGPPQAVSTKHSVDRISVHSLKSNIQRGSVDGSFGSRFVATTMIPNLPTHTNGDVRTSIPAPALIHPPLPAVRFIGPLNFVQPDQPFLVGRNVVVRSGKEISSLRGKFASLPSLPSKNVFLNPVQLPLALPWTNPPSFQQPKFGTVQPSEFSRALRPVPREKISSKFTDVLNGVEHDKSPPNYPPSLLKTIPLSGQTKRRYQTTTDRTVTGEETGQPFFINHQEVFKIISIPSNDFRISEQTQMPQRIFSVTTSVRLNERPLQMDYRNLTIQTTTLPPFSSSSSRATPPKATITTQHLKNMSSTSVPLLTDDKILPNAVLSFTEAGFSQAFRVGHNIVRVKLSTEETTTSPSSTTSKHTKHQIKSTSLAPSIAVKKIDLPETSEFSESPFAYYDGPQKLVPALPRWKPAKKSTLGETRSVPFEDAPHRDRNAMFWGAKYGGMKLSYLPAQGTSRTYPKHLPITKPSTSTVVQQLLNQTEPQTEVPSKHTAATEPSNVKPEHHITLQQPSSSFVGSPSLYGERPIETQVKSLVDAYRDPESELQTTVAFVDGRRTFRIDARRMRKILDEYLPKALPINDASNSINESFTKEAFNENERNKLIEGIISAIESMQKFSESIRREMRQVLRDSFIATLTHQHLPKSKRFKSTLSSTSKLVPSKSIESNLTSDSLIQRSQSNKAHFKVIPTSYNSLTSATTATDRVATTQSLTAIQPELVTLTSKHNVPIKNTMDSYVATQQKRKNIGGFLPWRTY